MRDCEAEFRDFVAARAGALLRTARLLTGSWQSGEDLLQMSLAASWQRWQRATRYGDPEAYVRRVMLTTFLSGRRRRWRVEVPHPLMEEDAYGSGSPSGVTTEERMDLLSAVSSLPPRQRAVVALRYLDDLSEIETARLLGCSVGTVKSQSAKAIAKLRDSLAKAAEVTES
jgi:RNA polymerase sigma-70 factor (sigma-E family)